MPRTVKVCGLCRKEYKSFFDYQVFMKALYKQKTCDLCGEKVSRFRRKYVQDGVICKDCEHFLRSFYNNNAEKCAAVISNALILALSVALETPLDGCGADDPMERATIAELRAIYEMIP